MVEKNIKSKRVLFVDGAPDTSKVYLERVLEDGNFGIFTSGSANVFSQLGDTDFDKIFLLLDANPVQDVNLMGADAIFNQIADGDTHKKTLEKLKNIRGQISKEILFFNLPLHVEKTTRENICNILQGIEKVYVPKTIKFKPKSPAEIYEKVKKDFTLPVIFRQAGDHGGVSTIIIDRFEDNLFYPFPLDGREYYITQYVDYKKDGAYQKIRLVVVDGEVFIRHVLYDNLWNIHAYSRMFMDKNIKYNIEEIKILQNFKEKLKPNIKKQITQIYEKIGLDYFGIDCYIDENFNMLIFEINANMNMLRINKNHPEDRIKIQKIQVDKIKEAINKMVIKRLKVKNGNM